MKLEVQKFSLALSVTMGIIYAVCAIFVTLWPDFSLQLFGWLICSLDSLTTDPFSRGL